LKTEYFTKKMAELKEDKIYIIKNSSVEAGISEECGFLYPVRFLFGDDVVEPMHIAPWIDETLDDSVPPMLKGCGEIFSAPLLVQAICFRMKHADMVLQQMRNGIN
jgi:hypothetical protein